MLAKRVAPAILVSAAFTPGNAFMTDEAVVQPYKRPPVTEAVIGIQLAGQISEADLRKVSSHFGDLYPGQQQVKTGVVQVVSLPDSRPPVTNVHENVGYRRTSDDATEIILFMPNTLIISQLSPYPGWDVFFRRFTRDWRLWKREMGFLAISRVGLRYINRIDIPINPNFLEQGFINQEEYLNVFIQLPSVLGPTSGYTGQAVLPMNDLGAQLVINTAVVPPPLLGHTSFLLDIDIGKIQAVPQRDEDIVNFLNLARNKKNFIFEACITDRARELFSQ
jgi:uncharacterized protein (TIGR04255 family)